MSNTPLDADYEDLEQARQDHLLEMERRFSTGGCPWGCDGSGWREVEEGLTACECNSYITVTEHGITHHVRNPLT